MDPTTTDQSATDAAAAAAAEDAAFESGFKDEHPYAPVPAPAPASEAPAPAAATPAPAPAEPVRDPYADLPPAVRDALAKIPTLEHEVVSNRGRIAGLNSALEEARARLSQVSAPPPPAPPKNEKVEAVRGELPEVADAIESAVAEALKAARPAAPPPPPAQAPSTTASSDEDPEMALLNSEHPGWDKKLTSTDFQLWLTSQPEPFRRQVMTATSSGVVITALGRFDRFQEQVSATAQVGAKRTSRMAAAVTPSGGARPAGGSKEMTEDEAFLAGFNGG